MSPARDTIFALSSGWPPAAIAVVRISGPRAGEALRALIGRLPEPRKAQLARVRDPNNGEIIDQALALWFPAPASATGEDVAELHLHGGRAVIAAALAALGKFGLRPAEPGEFTRRAFENGRLDLTAVEGLADLIYAETEAQRRQALRQFQGALFARAEGWRARLTEALALVEARIDFADEADVPEDLMTPALAIARELRDEIEDALAQAARGERLREGLVVAIAGPPNVGKSTLLNRIAQREAAIVSPTPGTTRDVIEIHLDLDGYPVTVLDTAGIRASDDPVEQEGVRRAKERAAAADLVLWMVEAGSVEDRELQGHPFRVSSPRQRIPGAAQHDPCPPLNQGRVRKSKAQHGISRAQPSVEQRAAPPHSAAWNLSGRALREPKREPEDAYPRHVMHIQPFLDPPFLDPRNPREGQTVWLIRNKADLLGKEFADLIAADAGASAASTVSETNLPPINESVFISKQKVKINQNVNQFLISARTGKGMNELMNQLSSFTREFFAAGESALISRERQRKALEECKVALDRALNEEMNGREDLIAEELRLAARALGRLTGRVDVEDILDVIFRDFCIGK